MKKITRIAALLAAGALLFGAVGCSSGGDGDETPPRPQTETVSYTLKDTPGFDSGSLKVSGMNTTDDTSDDTFEMTLKLADEDAKTVTGTWEVTDTGFVCKSNANVTIGKITVNAGESVSGTLNEDNSEITLEVSDDVSLVFVKDEDSGGNTPVGKSFTVDFVGLKSNDFDPAVTFSEDKQKLPASSETKVKNVTLYSRSEGSLIVRNANGECTGINYGGSSFNNDSGSGSLGATADTSLYARVIYVPVESAGTLKVTYKTTYTKGKDDDVDKGQIGAYDADGKLIGEVASVAGVDNDKPLTVNVSAATKVAILYARNGTTAYKDGQDKASGGIDVTKIEFTVAESDGNTGNTGGNTGNTGDNTGNTGNDSGNTGDSGNNESGDQGGGNTGSGGGNENQGGGEEGDGNGGSSGEGGGEDNEPVIVNAIFTMAKNVGDGNPFGNLKDETDVTDIAVTADNGGNGASLTFSGKIKTENNAINVSKATKISMANLESARGCFTLTLKGSAKVKVHYKASGDVSEERFVVIADSDDTKITGVSPADKTNEYDLETDEALEAGIYKIYVNGCKIYSVTVVSK